MLNSQPIEQRRGIDSIDINQSVILVRASIEQVAQTLAQILEADSWERDVYDPEIELLGQDFVVFQFRGHPWSTIHQQGYIRFGKNLGEKDAQSLSELLQTRVIYYSASDTSGTIGYQFYDAGQLVERLYFDHSTSDREEDDVSNEEGPVLFRPSAFESQLRQLKAENIDNSYAFTNKLCRNKTHISLP